MSSSNPAGCRVDETPSAPDIVDDDESDAGDPFDRFGDGVIGAVATDEGAELVDTGPRQPHARSASGA